MMKWFIDAIFYFFNSIKAGWQGIRGIYLIYKMHKPIITIFASGRIDQTPLNKLAFDLTYRLVKDNYSILTGGGPGIMNSLNWGAYEAAKDKKSKELYSVGIGVHGVDKDFNSQYMKFYRVSHFFLRKWLFMRYSSAFIVFPGGIGTMDELFELLNEFKHHHLNHQPVILVGVDFWKPIITWYHNALADNYIGTPLKSLLICSDDIDDIITTLKKIK